MKILVTPTSFRPDSESLALKRLMSYCPDLVFNPYGRPLKEKELKELLKDCDGYLAGLDDITGELLKNAPKLRAISRYGAGYDRVDTAAAKANHIPVSNTPGANAQAVAELAFGMILALARKIPFLHYETVKGNWVRSTGIELKGKTLGIVGLGAIGKKVAQCSLGFDMRVLAYDPFIQKDYCMEHRITPVSLDTLLSESDVITLHLPLNDSTFHLIDGHALALVKPSAIIVNASRGGVVDEDAAFASLSAGKLGGLGLDAFEQEPPKDSPLFTLPNVIATPHTGAHTQEATNAMADMAVENLITMLEGRECKYIVNN